MKVRVETPDVDDNTGGDIIDLTNIDAEQLARAYRRLAEEGVINLTG